MDVLLFTCQCLLPIFLQPTNSFDCEKILDFLLCTWQSPPCPPQTRWTPSSSPSFRFWLNKVFSFPDYLSIFVPFHKSEFTCLPILCSRHVGNVSIPSAVDHPEKHTIKIMLYPWFKHKSIWFYAILSSNRFWTIIMSFHRLWAWFQCSWGLRLDLWAQSEPEEVESLSKCDSSTRPHTY